MEKLFNLLRNVILRKRNSLLLCVYGVIMHLGNVEYSQLRLIFYKFLSLFPNIFRVLCHHWAILYIWRLHSPQKSVTENMADSDVKHITNAYHWSLFFSDDSLPEKNLKIFPSPWTQSNNILLLSYFHFLHGFFPCFGAKTLGRKKKLSFYW